MTRESPKLRTPTTIGQTGLLVRVDGAVAALVMWEHLPYWLRARWADKAEAVAERELLWFIEAFASPLALDVAAASERMPEKVRAAARRRLAEQPSSAEALAQLRRHFARLIDRSQQRLLVLMSTGKGADADLDRVDLLGEVVALRGIQSAISSERGLARAFRAMFTARDPWVLYALIALMAIAFAVVTALPADEGKTTVRALALYPDLSRPWTLLTYPWLHVGLGHLVLNLVALALVGHVVERVLGHARFIVVYLGCAIGAGLASVLVKQLFDIPFWSVGASGAIAGMAGLALFLGLWFQSRYGRIPVHYAGGTIAGGLVLASNMIIAATSGDAGLDHGAHIGGLGLGVVAGLLLRPRLAARADQAFGFGSAAARPAPTMVKPLTDRPSPEP